MVDSNKASITEIKEFFQADGGPAVSAKEIIRLKKTPEGVPLPDYDQIAIGIKNGTLTY